MGAGMILIHRSNKSCNSHALGKVCILASQKLQLRSKFVECGIKYCTKWARCETGEVTKAVINGGDICGVVSVILSSTLVEEPS